MQGIAPTRFMCRAMIWRRRRVAKRTNCPGAGSGSRKDIVYLLPGCLSPEARDLTGRICACRREEALIEAVCRENVRW